MPQSRLILVAVAGLVFALPISAGAGPGSLPRKAGQCVATTIKQVRTRLIDGDEPVEGSGSDVEFTNGGRQVSYDTIPAIEASKPGDAARMCLLVIPDGCPAGDGRGRVYRTTNLRTGQSWVLSDSEHRCGGA